MGNNFGHLFLGLLAAAIISSNYGLVAAWALVVGTFFPSLDHIFKEKGRSWVTHTAFAPQLIISLKGSIPFFSILAGIVPFFAFGMILHLLIDFNHYGSGKRKEIWLPVISDILGKKVSWWMTVVISILSLIPFVYGVKL